MSWKQKIPWQIQITVKLLSAYIPLVDRLRLQKFRRGSMSQPDKAYGIFKRHFDRVDYLNNNPNTILELGPGASLFSVILARAFGAEYTYLVDAGNYATEEIEPYLDLIEFLRDREGVNLAKIQPVDTKEELLQYYQASYLTDGLNSLKSLPSESVDFVFSHAVLEHIRLTEFSDTMKELRRIIRPHGICSHCIDLKDHFVQALNNLRFSQEIWESDLVTNAGFYTNRLRYSQLLQLFDEAGFETEIVSTNRWEHLPTPKHKLSAQFQNFSDEELCISGFDVILKPI